MSPRLTTLLTAFAVALVPTPGQGQNAPFTVDDALEVGSLQLLDVSVDGSWAAATRLTLQGRLGLDSHRFGDPTYVSPARGRLAVVDTHGGETMDVFGEDSQTMAARWSPDGERLAILGYVEGEFELSVFDRTTGRVTRVSPDARIAGENSPVLVWSADNRLLLPFRPPGWAERAAEEFDRLTKGPVTVHRGGDPFLAWEALRRKGAEVWIGELTLDDVRVREVVPATLLGRGGFHLTEDKTAVVYEADLTEKTSYDVIFGTTGEFRTVSLEGDAPSTVVEVPEGRRVRWSRDGMHYAFSEKGSVYTGSLGSDEPTLAIGPGPDPEEGDDTVADSDATDAEDEPSFALQAISPHGRVVVASSDQGLWHVETASGEAVLMVEQDADDDEAPNYDVIGFGTDPDEVLLQYGSRTEWERGISRWRAANGRLEPLLRDSRLYNNFVMSESGSRFVFNSAEGNRPYDLHAASPSFDDARRILASNPDLQTRRFGDTELVRYLDVDGDRLNGVVYYPPDYVKGTLYPTIFLVYEEFFDDRFNATINVLTNAGYVVIQPSVDLEVGFPGEAWAKGVTAAANTLIEMGVADPDRLGVHGTSYGGYATNLLVTQTDRFKAAINISGKVDMISFYTDSPRLGVRNIHAPENSQDRIGATLWEQPQKYIAHSAIMFADRIETPLLLMTGEQDHNVPARTTFEMYYALRRLGKPVEWVNYVNGGHGMPRTTEVEVRDYYTRILDWYERYLGDEAAAQGKVSSDNR